MLSAYKVDVFARGELVSTFTVPDMPDSQLAIAAVEARYGEPPTVSESVVYDKHTGRKEIRLVVSGWHGYSFEARQIN